MVHFFILLPLLIILSLVMVWLSRRHPEDTSFYYFRNFLIIWSLCTLAIGGAETFWGTPYAKSMALSFAVPFLYVAGAFLVKLPFALYQKKGAILNILLAAIVIAGVIFGATTFVSANKLVGSLGPLSGFFEHMARQLTLYRIWSTLIIFVPVGIFFYFEAARSKKFENGARAVLVGSGLIVAGISEWFHIQAKHAASADFYTVLGFFLITAGLLYPLWKSRSSAAQASVQAVG